jgi:hypothetical protein
MVDIKRHTLKAIRSIHDSVRDSSDHDERFCDDCRVSADSVYRYVPRHSGRLGYDQLIIMFFQSHGYSP